jgi:hypothetical protein
MINLAYPTSSEASIQAKEACAALLSETECGQLSTRSFQKKMERVLSEPIWLNTKKKSVQKKIEPIWLNIGISEIKQTLESLEHLSQRLISRTKVHKVSNRGTSFSVKLELE